MTCRERWWWSNSWLGAFFFSNFIFCLSCGISRPPWTIFFSFYYRRNSWVVSTFFFVRSWPQILFVSSFICAVSRWPSLPWGCCTLNKYNNRGSWPKKFRVPTDIRTSKLKQNPKTNENSTIPEIFRFFGGIFLGVVDWRHLSLFLAIGTNSLTIELIDVPIYGSDFQCRPHIPHLRRRFISQ